MATDQEVRVRKLIKRLRHADPVVRVHAGVRLGDLGPAAREAVPALLGLLQGGSAQDRKLAALTLGYIGDAATEVVQALRASLRDPEEGVRRLAATALARIDAATGSGKAA
jgi:HEAT repeat protein